MNFDKFGITTADAHICEFCYDEQEEEEIEERIAWHDKLAAQAEMLLESSGLNVMRTEDLYYIVYSKTTKNAIGAIWGETVVGDDMDLSFVVVVDDAYARQGIASELIDSWEADQYSWFVEMDLKNVNFKPTIVNNIMYMLLGKMGYEKSANTTMTKSLDATWERD